MCNLAVAKSALSILCHLSEQVALVAVKLKVIEILNMKKIFFFCDDCFSCLICGVWRW